MEHCPQCGVELDPGSPEGLCAGCLFAGGFSLAEGTETKLTMGTLRIAVSDPQAALEYDSFGPYHILRVLGEGGMGTVYLAEQTQPIQRQVALKVIKPGMDTREILSRFAYQRQALALMDHPNIARVYNAGATEMGRPYFVMEYIDGIPITQYCDAHRLNTRERLELFVPVCQALQHAHSKGVIHRDIKPSNVMVIEQDGRAVPKMIDFGIAEILERLGQPAEALAYMSRELEHSRLQLDADPKNIKAIRNVQDATHALDRFEWERAGEKGQYTPLGIPDYLWSLTGTAALQARTLADVRASVAWYYVNLGGTLEADGDPVRIRRAVLQGLEMHEALLRDEPQDEANAKNGILSALQHLADGSILMAGSTSGEERRRNPQEARDYLVRANTVEKDLETKRLPGEDLTRAPAQIAEKLATVDAWLQEPAQVSAAH